MNIYINNFVRLGGKPKKLHPLAFVLQECNCLGNWFGKEDVI